MDVLPRLKLLNALTAHTPVHVPYLYYLQTKEFIRMRPVHGLNLNRRSISGLEEERS